MSSEGKVGRIFVISAPSGTGKTTIIKKIKEIKPAIRFSISATTRAPRGIEVPDKDYYFISREEFQEKIAKDEFVEWEEVFGNLYGTLKSELITTISRGEDIFLEVDVKGALKIKGQFPEAILIFLMPPSFEELITRLRGRSTESPEQLERRISRAEMEISQKDKFDYTVVNNDLSQCVNEVLELIEKPKTIGGNQ
ncbi:MAG: guanylate kinase [Ignavibacteriales bacterium]|nr:Guanylate kinase [Ignavibacteriaceae bacterium]MCZ2143211.1 guanylate kinase [Ignavibacteriales bacterium]WKZ72460.1 MAG: guanylate kinase [Ignavibacteriaceae bacterium]